LTQGRITAAHGTVQSYSPGCANVQCTTHIGIRTVPMLSMLSHFEYIDHHTCLACPRPALFRPQNYPFTSWTPSNKWFLGPPESTSQTAYRSVQPPLQSLWSWQTDRQTDNQSINF